MDYNTEILEIIKERMKVGKERYGHGLRIDDDTRQWGTKMNSWTEMALEEMLDGMIYISAQMLRMMYNEQDNFSIPEYLQDHYEETTLGPEWFKLTDKEKKYKLDNEMDKYFQDSKLKYYENKNIYLSMCM